MIVSCSAYAAFSGFYRTSPFQISPVLNFFRSNPFYIGFFLALYVVWLHAGALLGYIQAPTTLPVGGLLYDDFFSWVPTSPFYAAVGATVLVLIQAISIHVVADEFRLMADRNWFPGLFYALVASAMPDFLFLSAPLVAATFLPFALGRVFSAYQKPNMAGAIFDAAFWISVASLFYPPAIWLLVAGFIGLGVVRSFKVSERVVFITGIFVPLFLAWVWYFWKDRGGDFRELQFVQVFHWVQLDFTWTGQTIFRWAWWVLVLILVWMGGAQVRKGNQAQKYGQVMYWVFSVGALSILFQSAWYWEHFLMSAAALGMLLAQTFHSFKSRSSAEIWHFLLFILVLCMPFFDQFWQFAAGFR